MKRCGPPPIHRVCVVAEQKSTASRYAKTAERLRKTVAATIVETSGKTISVTVSIGVASRSPGVNTIERLLQVADAAMYRAKSGGRNRTVRFDTPDQEWGATMMAGPSELNAAADPGLAYPFQPPMIFAAPRDRRFTTVLFYSRHRKSDFYPPMRLSLVQRKSWGRPRATYIQCRSVAWP